VSVSLSVPSVDSGDDVQPGSAGRLIDRSIEQGFQCPHGMAQWLAAFGMNEVNARRARLVLGWVTVFGRVFHLGM